MTIDTRNPKVIDYSALAPHRSRLRRTLVPALITILAVAGLCVLMSQNKSLPPAAVVSTPAVVVTPEITDGNVVYGGTSLPDGPNPFAGTEHDNIYTGFGADHGPKPLTSSYTEVIWDWNRKAYVVSTAPGGTSLPDGPMPFDSKSVDQIWTWDAYRASTMPTAAAHSTTRSQ